MLTCEEDLAHESSWAVRASWVSWVRTFVGMASGTRYGTGSGSDAVVSKIVALRGARSLPLPVPYRWSSFGALNPHLLQTAAERVRMQVEHLPVAGIQELDAPSAQFAPFGLCERAATGCGQLTISNRC